ncbi:MAG TPA: molybdate ABC transporter substrate-binding protein [Pseudonocardiaceae bacterium]
MKKWLVGIAAGGLLLAGCTGGGGSQASAPTTSAPPTKVPVTVLAASSLTDVFGQLKPEFEKANPGADLRFSFGGSSDLSQQIVNGAPADVFASANPKQMTVVSDAKLVDGTPQTFTTNVLTIVVPKGNPKGIKTFADLARPGATVVVCAPQVPCGSATQTLEKATNTTLKPASEEPDVRSVLSKVTAGEADAGLVYVTDARTAKGKVEQIDFPEAGKAINNYVIAALKNSKQSQYAHEFVDFVLGPEGQQALVDAGFSKP